MRKLAVMLMVFGSSLATGALAAEIYKWVDEDGNVHYGDRPTGEGVTEQSQIERVAVTSRPTDAEQVQAGIDARLERQSVRADARAAREEEEKEQEALRAEAAERAEKCATYRERLQRFVQSRRLYRVDDSGERTYLDEGQMEEARTRVQQQVEEYCSP